jgi:hypothetical protein
VTAIRAGNPTLTDIARAAVGSAAWACPVHEGFDPLSDEVLADPYTVLAALPDDEPGFYAPSLDHYVVTRYADVEAIFLDPET